MNKLSFWDELSVPVYGITILSFGMVEFFSLHIGRISFRDELSVSVYGLTKLIWDG